MRQIIVAVCVAFVLSLGMGVSAQGCAKCFVVANIDVPAIDDAVSGTWVIAGWGFLCESGRGPDRVDLYYQNAQGFYTPVPWWKTTLVVDVPRPDVVAVFISVCPNLYGQSAGWHLYVEPGAVPVGHRHLLVNVWRSPYYSQLPVSVSVTE